MSVKRSVMIAVSLLLFVVAVPLTQAQTVQKNRPARRAKASALLVGKARVTDVPSVRPNRPTTKKRVGRTKAGN